MKKLFLLLLLVTATVEAQSIDYVKTQWSFYKDHIVQTMDCSEVKEQALKEINLYGMDTIAKYALIASWRDDRDLTEMTTIMQSKYYVCVILIDGDRYSSKAIELKY